MTEMTCPIPLFLMDHTIQERAETEPQEGTHYVYDHIRDEAKWLVADMGTTVTTCGNAGRPDDTQND